MIIPWIYYVQADEQLLVESLSRRWTVNGPRRYTARPFERITRRSGLVLGPTEYVYVTDSLTGQERLERGPQLLFPTAYEEIGTTQQALPLKKNQYVRILDRSTGQLRVERGEQSIYLQPNESQIGNIEAGYNIDEHHAVLVRSTTDGQLNLITTPQVFIPTAEQEVIEHRQRILLENHEVVVIKDRDGRYQFRRGSQRDRSFFLEPYTDLVTFRWSSGLHKDKRNLIITHLDIRPKFMWYAFEARTQDNVEIMIDITFFWQLADVEAMIVSTDDAPGDICAHARSAIIQAVSQTSLERFLANFNSIVRDAVIVPEDGFYAERGVKLHSVEVRSITCKDANTQRVLQEIIQETTNRLNRLQKQESENEIKVKQLEGEIVAQETRSRLLELQRRIAQAEAETQGLAEAERVHAFIQGLGAELPISEKLAIFNILRRQEAIASLSQGKAQLYLTPADINLNLEHRS